ncbi:AT hook motif protein [Streptomyces sp. NPDC001568]|uniref:AT hook motif protein n=1 Tax=Streptomyces sp. NPDC001568 TaxID=3364588 RepID=UPI0036D1AB0E
MSPAGGVRPGAEPEGPEQGRSGPEEGGPGPVDRPRAGKQARKQVLLRLDPQVYEALSRWAGEELRSANAQIEFLLRRALSDSGRLPGGAAPIRPRGRPRNTPES